MEDEEVSPIVLELVELGTRCGPGTKIASVGSTREEIAENLRIAFDNYKQRKESGEDYFNWEEMDYCENRLMYDYQLEHLQEPPTREKIRRKNVKEID